MRLNVNIKFILVEFRWTELQPAFCSLSLSPSLFLNLPLWHFPPLELFNIYKCFTGCFFKTIILDSTVVLGVHLLRYLIAMESSGSLKIISKCFL